MLKKANGETFTEVVLEVFKVSGMLNVEGDDLTKEFGLSSARWKVMGAIGRSETALTVPQIGRTMGQSRQATQRIVDVMTKDGLLQLVENPHHKRAKLVDLTEQGKKVYRLLDIKQTCWASKGAEDLSKEELETTLFVLQKMASYLGAQ
ncbi:MarR family winged helix-turn-helix transcriptional regulator [Vibrio algarum]|uniref:MarR family transcriptional regulator n=1 Tax=Vibrio algarum TaxID=3020714 RepID=A0ABT4YVR1_9VIBR|nr:MarR family transcriptional regulator [Vibrio sp. KJ40-1]MDB1125477.1 MarR family transcriptional regulator [Vibrio sp. KJ40-1]